MSSRFEFVRNDEVDVEKAPVPDWRAILASNTTAVLAGMVYLPEATIVGHQSPWNAAENPVSPALLMMLSAPPLLW